MLKVDFFSPYDEINFSIMSLFEWGTNPLKSIFVQLENGSVNALVFFVFRKLNERNFPWNFNSDYKQVQSIH